MSTVYKRIIMMHWILKLLKMCLLYFPKRSFFYLFYTSTLIHIPNLILDTIHCLQLKGLGCLLILLLIFAKSLDPDQTQQKIRLIV